VAARVPQPDELRSLDEAIGATAFPEAPVVRA
jgi:hypothetical protein